MVEFAHRQPQSACARRVVEGREAVRFEVSGGFTIGDDEDHRLRVGMPTQVTTREHQGVVQIGALLVDAVEPGEFGRRHHTGVPAERDELQRIPAEARGHEMVEREGRAFHRHPATVHDHRERRVDEQRDRRLRPLLGLDHLDVLHRHPHRQTGTAQGRVGEGPYDVPRFGVAELPCLRRAGRFAEHTRPPRLALPGARRDAVDDVAQRRFAEPAHGLGRQAPLPVGTPVEEALPLQFLLEFGEGACIGCGLGPEMTGERVEVDVVEGRPGVLLRQLLGELVEFGQLLQRRGGLAETHALFAAHLLGAGPVLAGTRGPQVAVETVELAHQIRGSERLLCESVEFVALLGGEGVAQPLRRRGPLCEGVEQFLDVLRVLREELAVLGHELLEVLLGVLTAGVLVEQVVEVLEHLRDALPVLVGGPFERLLHPGEALVEHLAAEQVADLLVILPGLRAAPVVVGEFLHGLRRRRG